MISEEVFFFVSSQGGDLCLSGSAWYYHAPAYGYVYPPQDVGQLRRDLNFAQHVLKADYENRLNERATEL